MPTPKKRKKATPTIKTVVRVISPGKDARPSTETGLRPGRKRTSIVVDASTHDDLKALAWIRKSTVSHEIAEAVSAYLAGTPQKAALKKARELG